MNDEITLQPLLRDDLLGQFVFLDEFGICEYRGIQILKIVPEEEGINGPFYIPVRGHEGQLQGLPNPILLEEIQRLFKKGVYVADKQANRSNPYYYGCVPDKRNAELVKVGSLQLRVNLGKCLAFYENRPTNMTEVNIDIDITKVDDFAEKKCVPLGRDINPMKVDIELLKEGDEIYLLGAGKASLTKLYGYPEDPERFCQLKLVNGETQEADIEKAGFFYYLPYEQHRDEFDELAESKNELLLLPVLRKGQTRGTYSYYWREVPGAARYIVKLYAIATVYGKKRLYRLTEIDLDRNTRYLVLPNIAGSFACKVIAEDREGKPIAISRASEGTNN